jgi:small subunit ribosomal protein S20
VANIKSQIKRNKQNEKRRVRNKATRSKLATQIKAAVGAAGTNEETEALKTAVRGLDKAAAKGVIHKKAASRKISRLTARVRQAASQS